MKKPSKKTIIIISVLLIITLIGGASFINARRAKIKEVTSDSAKKATLSYSISVTGNIEANDKQEIILSQAQKVLDVFYKEGDNIKKDALLISLDTSDLEYQRQRAVLNRDLAKESLAKLQGNDIESEKKRLNNNISQANLSLETTQSALLSAEDTYLKNKALYDNGYISKEEYDRIKKTYDDAKTQLESQKLQLESAKSALTDYEKNISYQISQQKTQIKLAEADLSNTNTKIADNKIKATINGVVVKQETKEGEYPLPGSNTMLIHDLSKYKLTLDVSQYDATSIALGQKAKLKIKGIDTEYRGSITYIGTIAELKQSGTNVEPKVEIEITIDNPDDMIKVGYEADAEISLIEKQNVVALNFESVLEEADGAKYIFKIEENEKAGKKIYKAKKSYVTTGLETDFDIEIIEGIAEGEKYISSPPQNLTDGEIIKLREVDKVDNKD